tara:strand:+ start:639 stop:2660 length:2022 start_codon:yes stop_codon:yes gene_type:complete
MAKMSDQSFQTLIQDEVTDAVNYYDTEFSGDRSETLDYYLGEKFGNEIENRSQVVATEVSDTIEFMMPTLVKMFQSSNDFVRFSGRMQEDVDAAQQATDLVNYVINSDNNGFVNTYNWFKDALLFKIGVLKSYWEEDVSVKTEQYDGLTEDELVMLLDDTDVELVSQDYTEDFEFDPTIGIEVPVNRLYSVEIKRTKTTGRVKIVGVPPEEFLFSRRATSIADCDFVGQRSLVKVGDLVAQGCDLELIKKHSGYDELDNEQEKRQRFQDVETGKKHQSNDPTLHDCLVTEMYLRADYDGDGIPELRRVLCIGNAHYILENDPFDHIPFSVLSPILMPHRMVGRSVAEMVKDLQLIKSTILRQLLDNLYLTNNSRVGVVEGQVNLDDLLSSRPGNIVRMRAPGMVQPLSVPQIGSSGFSMLEYIDQVRDQRTGFSKASLGLDPKALQSTTANAVNSTIQGAQLKVEMIARVFAETGCRDLAKTILHLCQKHMDEERIIRIRNEYIPIDPSEWENEFDMSVDVGLGNGREDEKMAMLLQIAGKQEQLIQTLGMDNPIVKPSQYVNTLQKIIEMGGFKDSNQFFNSPEQMDQLLAQQEQNKNSIDPATQELQLEKQKMEAEIALKREKMMLDIELEREKAQQMLALRREELQAELDLRRQKIALGGDVSMNLPSGQ